MKNHAALVEMLQDGNLPAKEIAETTGYSYTYVKRCLRHGHVPAYCKDESGERTARIVEMSRTMTKRQIANELGLSWSAVRAVLRRSREQSYIKPSITRRYGERKFVDVEPFRTWLHGAVVESGGIEESARRFGIAARTIRRILREQTYVTVAVVDQCVTAAGLPHLVEEWYGSTDA